MYNAMLSAEANALWKLVGLISRVTRKVALAKAGTA